ncbi:MAG: hypothetical protein SF339_05245 [Blastocatellia bacterium]|nr:hypothetical protein [Blastocatellia bacterium]
MKRTAEELPTENAKRPRLNEDISADFLVAAQLNPFPTQQLAPVFMNNGKIPGNMSNREQRFLLQKALDIMPDDALADVSRRYQAEGHKKEKYKIAQTLFEDVRRLYIEKGLEAEKQIADLLEADRQQAMKVTGGSLNILFAPVGHGDCTIMKTPKGKILMIDCGSEGGMELKTAGKAYGENWERLRDSIKLVLGTEKRIHFLILTHPDQDHFNLLMKALPDSVQIERIYHSDEFGEYKIRESPNLKVEQDALSEWLVAHMHTDSERKAEWNPLSMIQQVTLRYSNPFDVNGEPGDKNPFIATTCSYKGENAIPIPAYQEKSNSPLNRLDANGGLLIWQEADLTVSILSSNVAEKHMSDDNSVKNRASVVVLVTAFGKKILICGDATFNTELELMARYPFLKARLKEGGTELERIFILRIGHHGSKRTSTQKRFADFLQAERAWISETTKSNHKSPALKVIKDLWAHVADVKAHDLYFWTGTDDSDYTNHQLSKCAGATLEEISFTNQNISGYLKKGVFLTATSQDALIVIPES